MKASLIFLIRVYRLCISPWIGTCCRFHPSCSEYGILAIKKHGALKGSYMTIKRLFKCHPYHSGGIDYP